ncbi:AAA family ATPase [Fodinicurvata sp. EGI_FJ10296]|uniref:AAA family ATPase n=1 Tax=Fodinicurvata sp. EGI_FJ10296 TaxID=3231908 RepID=UPI0034563993
MHIAGWHVDGFGILNNWRVDDLDGKPLIVQGRNEAGKSTLLAFLQGVLFGFPKGRNDRKYHPLAGGTHGGRIVLATPDGELTIARGKSSLSVTRADGTVEPESVLETALGHTDARVFRNVFAFGLWELESFKSLNADGIREQLFSAGLLGAGRSASAALAELDGRIESLLKPRSGPLKEIADEIDRLKRKLAESRASVADHADLARREEAAAAEADEARRRARSHEEAAARAELLQRLWPVQVRIAEARSELAAGTDCAIDLLALEGEINALIARTGSCREQIAEFETREANLAKTVASLAPDPAIAGEREAVAAAVAHLAAIRDKHEARAALEAEVSAARRRLNEVLGRLGPDWSPERLTETTLALADRNALTAARQRRDEAARTLTAAQQAETAAEEAVQAAGDAANTADEAVDRLPSAPTAEALDEQDRRLRHARQLTPRVSARAREAAQAQAALQQAERNVDAHPPDASGPGRALPVLAAGILALSAAGFGYAAWPAAGEGVDAATAIASALCLVALAALIAWMPKFRADLAARAGRRQAALDARDAAHMALQLAEQAAADTVSACRDALRAAGLADADNTDPDHAEVMAENAIADGEAAIATARTARHQRDRALERQAEAREKLRHETARRDKAIGARQDAERGDAEAEAEWRHMLAGCGLPDTLTTDGLTGALALIDQATDRAADVRREEDRLSALDAQLEAWRRDMAALAARLELSPLPESVSAAIAVADSLTHRLKGHDATVDRRSKQQDSLERVQQDLEKVRAQMASANERLRGIAAEAGLPDPDHLPAALQTSRRRATLQDAIRADEAQRRAQVGDGDAASSILAELETGQLEAWRESEQIERDAAEQARTDADAAFERSVELRTEREQVEASADIPALENALAGHREAFENGLAEWREVTLAARLIRDTLADFQKARQPAVLQKAGLHFRRVTGGRYSRVLQDPQNEGAILVEPESGLPITDDALSRGTAEQLYLAMRLGLVADYGERRARLPVIVDDVFVNFDPARARAMAESFLDLAPEHQVMMFTCHPWVVDTFRSIDPTIRVLALPDANADAKTGAISDATSAAMSEATA